MIAVTLYVVFIKILCTQCLILDSITISNIDSVLGEFVAKKLVNIQCNISINTVRFDSYIFMHLYCR